MTDCAPSADTIEAAAKDLATTNSGYGIWLDLDETQRDYWRAKAKHALTAAWPLLLRDTEQAIRADERAKIAAEIRAIAGSEIYANEHARGYRTGIISAANWTENNGAACVRANARRAARIAAGADGETT